MDNNTLSQGFENSLKEDTRAEVTVDHAIKILNDAAAKDNEAIKGLMTVERSCNKLLAEHPVIQVKKIDRNVTPSEGAPEEDKYRYEVTLLGLLNGIFGIRPDGYGHITMIDDPGNGKVRFIKTSDWKDKGAEKSNGND